MFCHLVRAPRVSLGNRSILPPSFVRVGVQRLSTQEDSRAIRGTPSTNTRSVLINGATPEGLTLALLLFRKGVQVDVVDKYRNFEQYKSRGCLLPINATRILKKLGLKKELKREGIELSQQRHHDTSGKEYGILSYHELEKEVKTNTIGISKENLCKVLFRACFEERIPMRMSARVSSFIQPKQFEHLSSWRRSGPYPNDDKLVAHFWTHRKGATEYDLLVDTTRKSYIRAAAFEEITPKNKPTWLAWHALVDAPAQHNQTEVLDVWAAERKVTLIPVGNNKLHLIACLTSQYPIESIREGTRYVWQLLEQTKEVYKDHSVLGPILKELASDEKLKIRDRLPVSVELPTFMNAYKYHSGRVALLGEAAHTMAPYFGQQEAMAIEDAAVLADLISDPYRTIDSALEKYTVVRTSRIDKVQEDLLQKTDLPTQQLTAVRKMLHKRQVAKAMNSSNLKAEALSFYSSSIFNPNQA